MHVLTLFYYIQLKPIRAVPFIFDLQILQKKKKTCLFEVSIVMPKINEKIYEKQKLVSKGSMKFS